MPAARADELLGALIRSAQKEGQWRRDHPFLFWLRKWAWPPVALLLGLVVYIFLGIAFLVVVCLLLAALNLLDMYALEPLGEWLLERCLDYRLCARLYVWWAF